jgi:hypothetical protein
MNLIFFIHIYEYMKEKNKGTSVRMTFLIDNDLRKNYKLFCVKHNYNMSDRIRQFMENEIKNK